MSSVLRRLRVFIAGFRPEHVFLVWVSFFVMAYLRTRIRRILKNRQRDQQQEEPTTTNEPHVVVVRGRRFSETSDADSSSGAGGVDLGWTGTIPYWIPTVVFGLEALQLSIFGERAFKLRGYSPKQRGFVQLVLFFGVLPVLDLAMGDDWANPTKAQLKDRKLAKRFRLPLYVWCAVEALATWSVFKLVFNKKSTMSRMDQMALFGMLSLFNGAFGITISHELIHKQSALEKFLGYLLLVNVNYVHWGEEHLSGHHETVATPQDPATAKQGETLYEFLPRTFIGGFRSSCKLEEARLEANNQSWYSVHNRILQGAAAPAAWSLVLAKAVGNWRAVPVFYVQAFNAALLLEVVNYLEHYGLQRKLLANGQYEPVNPTHSWNAPNRLSNAVLFKLQRHSDHHTYASRPYEILRCFRESPQLPTGYPGCFVMALIPPVWFNIMNDLLKAHRLEFADEREPTQEERNEADRLKQIAAFKTWMFATSAMAAVSVVLRRTLIQSGI
jgi:alkane 1-monooxygenase